MTKISQNSKQSSEGGKRPQEFIMQLLQKANKSEEQTALSMSMVAKVKQHIGRRTTENEALKGTKSAEKPQRD